MCPIEVVANRALIIVEPWSLEWRAGEPIVAHKVVHHQPPMILWSLVAPPTMDRILNSSGKANSLLKSKCRQTDRQSNYGKLFFHVELMPY
jgi:hypothetical protein